MKLLILFIVIVTAGMMFSIPIKRSLKKGKYKDYKFITELETVGSYKVTKISRSSLCYHGPNEFIPESEIGEDGFFMPREGNEGFIYYDSVQKSFWIEERNYDTTNDWVNFDMEGKIIQKTIRDSLKERPGEIMKNEIPGIYNWDDKTSGFYVDYFQKERYCWRNLNPFYGMGNPTGPPPKVLWSGTEYLNLLMQDTTIQFKFKNYSMPSSYLINMELYRLDDKELSGEIAFLYFFTHHCEGRGLYMISKCKDKPKEN